MKRLWLLGLLCVMGLCSSSAWAQGPTPFAKAGSLGAGLGGSNYVSGITAKYYLSDRLAGQAVIGTWGGYGLGVTVDGIYEMDSLYKDSNININWNLGAGLNMASYTYYSSSYFGVGVNGVIGLALQVPAVNIEVVTELRPLFGYGYYSAFGFGGGGAIRYYFR